MADADTFVNPETIEQVNPETIEQVSRHPIYGIAEDYGQICIQNLWYRYDPLTDRLVRFTKPNEDLFYGS